MPRGTGRKGTQGSLPLRRKGGQTLGPRWWEREAAAAAQIERSCLEKLDAELPRLPLRAGRRLPGWGRGGRGSLSNGDRVQLGKMGEFWRWVVAVAAQQCECS